MNDNDNSVAKILIADELLRQEQNRAAWDKQRALNEQSLRNQEEVANLKKENEKKAKELEDKLRSEAAENYHLQKQYNDLHQAFLDRSYNNIYHQSMLYGTRFLLLDLAKQLNIPNNILIKISLLSTDKYMNNPNEINNDLKNYFISYSNLLKERHYEYLLEKKDWKTSYNNRLHKTMREARAEIAQYILNQTEKNPFLMSLLANIDSRFGDLEETKKILDEIQAEFDAEKAEENRKIALKEAEEVAKEEKTKQLIVWAKEEKELLENSNIVIHQGQPLKDLFLEHTNKNYYWIPLLKFLSRAKIEMLQTGEERKKGGFFNSQKDVVVTMKIHIEKSKDSEIQNMDYGTFLPLIVKRNETSEAWRTFEEDENAQYYNFGYVPVKTKFEKIQMYLELQRLDENRKYIKTRYPFTFILNKPFIAS